MLKLMGIRLSLIWLVMAMAATAQILPPPPPPPVLDTDGQPLLRGAEYYINPAFMISSLSGPLTLIVDSRFQALCPIYFVGEEQPFSSRLPVTFAPVEESDEMVRERKNFKATFSKDAKCGVSTTWKVGKRDAATQKRLIETGDGGRFGNYFLIERSSFESLGGKNNIYILRYCPTELCPTCKFECGNFETLVSEITGDRLMSLGTDGTAIAVQFERVLLT